MDYGPFLLDHDWVIRMAVFFGVLISMALWEVWSPRRVLLISKTLRWRSNLSMAMLNMALLRALFPLGAVGAAQLAVNNGWGLLNYFQAPLWIAVPAAVIALDIAIWLQHVLIHAVPMLWRLHRVHHADLDFDVSTGIRFHPIEMVGSMLIKLAAIAAIGPPAIAVMIFEVMLNATSMFNHANVRMPARLERALRWLVVTPDMHRVHHSINEFESNSNFGFCLPWWDRLFGTYRDQPRAGHVGMTIGISGHLQPREVSRLVGMLRLPFRSVAD